MLIAHQKSVHHKSARPQPTLYCAMTHLFWSAVNLGAFLVIMGPALSNWPLRTNLFNLLAVPLALLWLLRKVWWSERLTREPPPR